MVALNAILTGCAAYQDWHYRHTNLTRTECAWVMATKNPLLIVHPGDFGHGWKQGYLCVADGGTGQPPTIPPNQYWSASYQSEKGREAIEEWYRGYHEGALHAEKCGVGRYHYLRTTPAAGHAEHVVSDSVAVEHPREPTPAPVNEVIVVPPAAAKVTLPPPAPLLKPLPAERSTAPTPVPYVPPAPSPTAPPVTKPSVPPAPTIPNLPQTINQPQLNPPRATVTSVPGADPYRNLPALGPAIQPLPPQTLPPQTLPAPTQPPQALPPMRASRPSLFDSPPVGQNGAANNNTASRNTATY